MAFCKNCGNQIDDNAQFCDKCGQAQSGAPQNADFAGQAQANENPVWAILALVFSIFGGLLGLIFSIIGLNVYKEKGSNRTMSMVGLILSIVWLVVELILIIVAIATGGAAVQNIRF